MIKRGFYHHWRGGIYFVHGTAINDADGVELVVYESVQGCAEDPQRMRTRTVADFTEEVVLPGGVAPGVAGTAPRFKHITTFDGVTFKINR